MDQGGVSIVCECCVHRNITENLNECLYMQALGERSARERDKEREKGPGGGSSRAHVRPHWGFVLGFPPLGKTLLKILHIELGLRFIISLTEFVCSITLHVLSNFTALTKKWFWTSGYYALKWGWVTGELYPGAGRGNLPAPCTLILLG